MRSALLACLLLAALAIPAEASSRGLTLGFGDPAFGSADRERALDQGIEANAEVVRLAVNWAGIAPDRPLDAENPADPAYRWAQLDAGVQAAAARGLDVILSIGHAPRWAEGADRPSLAQAPDGTWRPDPVAYGQFARAVARRFSGAFAPSATQAPLPRVTKYQAGNEPNLATYLTPQWTGGKPEAARNYRGLLTAFHSAVKSADPSYLVLTAGTAPYGDDPGGRRTRPLTFLRELLCLNGGSLATAGCDAPVPFDVLAHHPINARRPFKSADHPEDATTPDIERVRRLLRLAEKKRRVLPSGPHPIWVTEFWWESDPPDRVYGVPRRKHARYTAEALYLFWKQRVPLVLGLQLADSPIDPAAPGDSFQTGLFYNDGRAKSSLSAFRFPVVAIRGRRSTKIWGRAPETGRLVIEERRDGDWRTIERLAVDEGDVFRDRRRGGGRPKVRARVAGERSLPYRATNP